MMKVFTILTILAILNFGLVAPAVGEKPSPTTAPAQPAQPTLPPLSPDCRSALFDFITDNTTNKCLPEKELLRLTAIIDPTANASTINNAIVAFATDVCPISTKCSDQTIKQISDNGKKLILEGCGKELNSSNPLAEIALAGITLFPPVIKSLCFVDNSTKLNLFCFVEDAATIQSLPQPNFTFVNPALDKVIFSDPSSFCVPCFQKIINTIFDFIFDPLDKAQEGFKALLALFEALKIQITALQLSQLKITVMTKCGFQFLDHPGV